MIYFLPNTYNVYWTIKPEQLFDRMRHEYDNFWNKNRKQKAEKIKQTKADYVITTCPSCILGLKQGLFLTGGKTKVVSLLEFLAMGVIK
jgi:Fe-S oxidoreductase